MSFTKAYVQCTYMPDPDAEPAGTLNPSRSGAGIPVLRLHQDYGSFSVQFDPDDPAAAIRYLRQLATVATDLADQVQAADAEGVAR